MSTTHVHQPEKPLALGGDRNTELGVGVFGALPGSVWSDQAMSSVFLGLTFRIYKEDRALATQRDPVS